MLDGLQHLINAERKRLADLTAANVLSEGQGKVLAVGAEIGTAHLTPNLKGQWLP